jgi:hypothetical protein
MRTDADALVRTTLALADPALRVAWLSRLLDDAASDGSERIAAVARMLDELALRAEQAEEVAREVLLSVVDALAVERPNDVVQRLREEAVGSSLLALERLVRHPLGVRTSLLPPNPANDPVPDYGRGRPLTLGERKSLARRPDRQTLDRLLGDPHPDVIRRLLGNAKLTEADVIRIAARRPSRPEILREIARAPRWIHNTRVRMTIMLNPDTPAELAVPISGLLMRQELRLVLESTHVAPAVRALCMERLERRPPVHLAVPEGAHVTVVGVIEAADDLEGDDLDDDGGGQGPLH